MILLFGAAWAWIATQQEREPEDEAADQAQPSDAAPGNFAGLH